MLRPALFIVAVALALLVAPAARAQGPRCAVPQFEGEVVLWRSFLRALEDNGFVSVIPEAELDAAAATDPVALARATSADLVIEGAVTGSRRSRRLEVVASDAAGRELARETISVRSGGAGRRALDQGISDLLSAALPALAAAPPPAAPTPVRMADAATDRPEDAPPAGPSSPPPPSRTEDGELGPNPPLLALRLGAVMRTRDAEALLLAGSPRSWRSEPVYVELYAGVELRPLASADDLARGLYLRAEFAGAVGLGSRDPMGRDVSTQFFRAGGDVGYLAPVGAVVEVGGGLGFGWDAYLLGANPNYPSVELPHLRPHLRSRLRLAGELVVIGVEAGLRIPVDRGALTAAFGRGDTLGFDASASVSGTADFGLSYALDLSWAGYWHSFSGGGAIGTGVSGVEHGFRLLVAAGYAFF
jgi:hypothetical protein